MNTRIKLIFIAIVDVIHSYRTEKPISEVIEKSMDAAAVHYLASRGWNTNR